MKKIILCIILILLFAVPSFAMNVIVGAKAGYFIWRPFYKDVNAGFFKSIENGDGVLYGPVLSMVLSDDISFSAVGLVGEQNASWSRDHELDINNRYVTGNYSLNVKRIDIDSALSYRVYPYFKLFAGYKYQSTDSTLKYVEHKSGSLNDTDIDVWIEKTTIDAKNQGPALGIGYSLPFNNSFFASANLSFLYMFGKYKAYQIAYRYNGVVASDPKERDGEFFNLNGRSIGLNFEPSIGAKVEESIIVTLGGRYQWMRIKFSDAPNEDINKAMYDHLYGFFVSVLLLF